MGTTSICASVCLCVCVSVCVSVCPEAEFPQRNGCRGLKICMCIQICLTRWKILKINFGVPPPKKINKRLFGGRTQICFFWGGLKSSKIIFDQFSRHFRQFWTTLIFSFLTTKFLLPPKFFWGGAKKFKNHFWQICTPQNFISLERGVAKKATKYFRPIFLPFQTIWNNFYFFLFWPNVF